MIRQPYIEAILKQRIKRRSRAWEIVQTALGWLFVLGVAFMAGWAAAGGGAQ